MEKTFEEIATDIVFKFIETKTDRNGHCHAGWEYDTLENITLKIKNLADELHRNYLNRESKAFDESVEQELSRR